MPQASMVHPDCVDPKDLKETEVLKEIRGLLDLKAIRAIMDPRVIPVESISAPSIVSPPVSMVVNETGIASLQCEVKGNPTPKVTWLKQNSSISPLNKRIVQSRGRLMIQDVTSQDGGVYTCRARNILGVMISSASLTVQGNLLPNINVPVVLIRCQT